MGCLRHQDLMANDFNGCRVSVNFASLQTCLLPEHQEVTAIHAEMLLFHPLLN